MSHPSEYIKVITSDEDWTQAHRDAGDKLVVVDFFATWCQPCKTMIPIFDQLALKHKDNVVFVKVNTDEMQELSDKCGVSSLPTFAFYKRNKKLQEFSGASPNRLTSMVEYYSDHF